MAIHVALNHDTRYAYDRLVELSPQLIRLRPAPHCRTAILSYSLRVEPRDHFENWQQDPQGNFVARCVFPEKTRELRVQVDLVAEMATINPFDFFVEPSAETLPFEYERWLHKELQPFLERESPGERLREMLASIDVSPRNTVHFLVDLNQRLQREIRYVIRMEPGIQTCEQTLALRSGSCRDSAWLLVQILRHLGLAARFVSGYLIQLVADVKPLDGPAGTERDFCDLHAWTEVYLPGAGWIGLDPTSGLLAGEGHLPLACTPDPQSAAPITGGVEPCECEFSFDMRVTRIHEDPRVTKPYTDEQWRRIEAVGQQVDQRLRSGDVRLTMGGEPTFVSIDDMEGVEWTFAAVGPTKRQRAADLMHRLRQRFAPHGLLHFGQGKWYPGESLPRWAFSCYWRSDGQPIWTRNDLIADEGRDYRHGAAEAERFTQSLAEQLDVEPDMARPVYEDVWHYLAQERRLPVNVSLADSKLKNEEERARLARVAEQGVGGIVGFILPLRRQWWQAQARWISGRWPVRTERIFLLPGDSPIGLRLPLESLPYRAPSAGPQFFERDPTERRGPLPAYDDRARQREIPKSSERRQSERSAEQVLPDRFDAGDVVHTALCVEPRQGRLHVFMPPVERADDYVDLLHAVEQTAASLDMPVLVEGYLPPPDYRLNHVKVTPDPGVIEVNIHPARDWRELVENTENLYEDARQARLGTEKFDLDGRHTGTGGGNHVVLGGPTPLDSPFLRRPDLLGSLVAYWNNHPSLSYLFSGSFIGPTSQAPRVDEGRRDAVYELEVAIDQLTQQIAPGGLGCPPWLVDRLFRNLLVDVSGNTHRAEFCIDKLYSPDSSSGRLGLVEFRAFEMPPHARMSLTQQLLLRALVARFWEQPYRERLVRWNTTLHDRFLLPHFVSQDFSDVLAEMQSAGIPIEREWFAPHFEFRFPHIGAFEQRGIQVELRQAIEPWYVLGEEPGAGGTARYVDSSVERLQVRVRGMTGSRHVVTCNGRVVPLHPTGTEGEFVAGVRYRAWQPPSCLHPTIPVHTPLVFDLVDRWIGRSLGGCTYHVFHPAGRNYVTFPVNAYEAESRRLSRFFRSGHTVGSMQLRDEPVNSDYPLTLDLRRRGDAT
jgi:uncharacterized protein (DUF2126 family)/transglutaminase-like putative cysteine protease